MSVSSAKKVPQGGGGAGMNDSSIPPVNQAFMAAFEKQAFAARQKNLRDGDLLDASAFYKALARSAPTFNQLIDESKIFHLDGPSGQLLYPAFFADPRYDRQSLEQVCEALGDLPGPSKWQFFTTGKASLRGQTPLEALANGELAKVLVTAAGFKER